jgi:nucleoside phosphorylase
MASNTVVLLTALEVEFRAVRQHLADVQLVEHPKGTLYEVGRFGSGTDAWRIAIVQTGPGNVRAAIEAERAIAQFDPSHAFFVGVAGGIKDLRLGDVVAATKVYGYERGRDESDFKTRADIGESSYDLVQRSAKVARDNLWQQRLNVSTAPLPHAIVAPIAAGEKVVASTASSTYELIRHNFSDAVAVEMEGLGVLRAGYANSDVKFLVIRGISDLIDNKAESDKHGSQEVASAHAAAFAFEVLAGLTPPKVIEATVTDVAGTGDHSDAWSQLELVAVQLYPRGPDDDEIWSRAGGDLSLLALNLIGKASWHSALRKLLRGGGGRNITTASLLSEMLNDYPQNRQLLTLKERLPRLALPDPWADVGL